ncbi:MAG: GNAT family N-acetyltransferase, partial [Mesorhizobium sp.]
DRGIGGRLMQAVEDLARRRGKQTIELQTRIELTENHAAFARLGFRETGRTAHEGYDRPTSITMRKVLS